jgi:hypothetical protein
MSAVIRLVESSGNAGGELPPLEQYEIWMQGRGLSHRTITEAMYTLRRLQREVGRPVHAVPALAISRFLASEALGPRARYAYHTQLSGFFRWYAAEHGGADTMARTPRPRLPRSVPRPSNCISCSRRICTAAPAS